VLAERLFELAGQIGVPDMIRFAIASLMLAGSALMALEPAYGQAVQYQFTPPPPIVSLGSSSGPSYPSIPGVASPSPAPGGSGVVPYQVAPPPHVASSRSSTRYVHTRRGRTIAVPPAAVAGQNTFGDRVSRCAHAGAASGLGPNQLGGFTAQCAN
jgi:hypothetical protein